MFTWLKNLFSNPKAFAKIAVDYLDLLVPTMASEIGKIEAVFNAKSPTEKAQWVVDKVQAFLTAKFKLDA